MRPAWGAFGRTIGRLLPLCPARDTGINRPGFRSEEVAALLDERVVWDDLEVSLVMSHLACADEPDQPPEARQLAAARVEKMQAPRGLPSS